MIQKLKRTIIGLVLMVGILAPALSAEPAYAQIDQGSKDAACAGLGAAGESCDSQNANSSVGKLLRTVISMLSWAVGIIAIIMMIIAGIKFVTAAGDANSIKSARDTMVYALVGAVIAVISQGLVRFVLKEATQATVQGGNSAQSITCPDGRRVAVGPGAAAGAGTDALCNQ